MHVCLMGADLRWRGAPQSVLSGLLVPDIILLDVLFEGGYLKPYCDDRSIVQGKFFNERKFPLQSWRALDHK